MKMKSIASLLAAGAMLACGTASAAVCGTAGVDTLGGWAAAGSCSDLDGDKTFIYNSDSIVNGGGASGTTGLTLTETTIGNIETYDLGFVWDIGTGFSNGYGGGGAVNYTVSEIPGPGNAPLSGVNFDTIVNGTTVATKTVDDNGVMTTLTSIDGSHYPSGGGELAIAPTYMLGVMDAFSNTNGSGIFIKADNSFVQHVPEPGSILLIGIGLMGLVYGAKKNVPRFA